MPTGLSYEELNRRLESSMGASASNPFAHTLFGHQDLDALPRRTTTAPSTNINDSGGNNSNNRHRATPTVGMRRAGGGANPGFPPSQQAMPLMNTRLQQQARNLFSPFVNFLYSMRYQSDDPFIIQMPGAQHLAHGDHDFHGGPFHPAAAMGGMFQTTGPMAAAAVSSGS